MNDVLTLAANYGPWAFFVVWAAERWGPKLLDMLSAKRKQRLRLEEEQHKRKQKLEDEELLRKIRMEERAIQISELFGKRLTELELGLQLIRKQLDDREQSLCKLCRDLALLVERTERGRRAEH